MKLQGMRPRLLDRMAGRGDGSGIVVDEELAQSGP